MTSTELKRWLVLTEDPILSENGDYGDVGIEIVNGEPEAAEIAVCERTGQRFVVLGDSPLSFAAYAAGRRVVGLRPAPTRETLTRGDMLVVLAE